MQYKLEKAHVVLTEVKIFRWLLL